MPGLLDRELVVVTGKGGVGKSTVATALAIAAARRGARVVVAEVGGRHDAGRLLEGTEVDHETVTPRAAMEEYLHDQLPGPLAELLSRSGTFAAFVEATPGMNELLSIGKVWELTGSRRRAAHAVPYDLVILDAPASGHGLAMLGAPRTFSDAARVGPIHRQAGQIHATLSDPGTTAVIAVALAEEMPVNETLELRAALAERMGIELAAVVVNGVVSDGFTDDEAERLRVLDAAAGTPVAAALWLHERARSHKRQLRRLRGGLDTAPLRLPFAFGEPDVDELATLVEGLL